MVSLVNLIAVVIVVVVTLLVMGRNNYRNDVDYDKMMTEVKQYEQRHNHTRTR